VKRLGALGACLLALPCAAGAQTSSVAPQAVTTDEPEDLTKPAKPIEASRPPSRPAILFNRWQEDWSILADPTQRTEPLDRLKYIPLPAADPGTYLSLGGGLRERFETNNAPSFGTNPANPADSYVISRLELHADLRTGPIQTFIQLQSDFAPGKKVRGPVDSDRLDLEQAFVALVEPLGSGTIKVRAGRQQFAFDLQRFVAARDGPNVRQSFDAVWGDYEIGQWRFIGYYSRPVANRDAEAFDDRSSRHNLFYGARVERHVLGGNELSAYWSRFSNDDASYLTVKGAEQRDVWDVRFAGKRRTLDWDIEGMGQTGHVGAQRVRAWAFGSLFGYTFTAHSLAPRIGLQIDGASGDRHPRDKTLGTFNPLFPNGYYVSLSGYTGYVNFLHVKPSLTVHPSKALNVIAATGLQWRMTTADAIYTQPTIPVARTAGTGSRWTGMYDQLRVDWRMTKHLSSALEAVHVAVGQTIRDAGGHDGSYLGVELKYGW
jgi:hypothetical protein